MLPRSPFSLSVVSVKFSTARKTQRKTLVKEKEGQRVREREFGAFQRVRSKVSEMQFFFGYIQLILPVTFSKVMEYKELCSAGR